ncbi:response regulator [Pedobacter sp. L105]|uniref:response regulator n=1 Tax=Pedobacter sp. L105 TaxID=1641871 RepID=UPI0020B1058A|nr:response regulator [Pedobacter sp. L105]
MSRNKTINILLVDDSTDNLMVLESALEKDNIKIYTTSDPKNVMDICMNSDISIALIDIKMPYMSGFELLDLIKSNSLTDNIMVILMTGYSMSTEDVVRGLTKGAVDYLFKPLDLYITTAKVNSLIAIVNYQREIRDKNKELETYQLELFKAVEEAEENKVVKENFLANMSHEIRTPLNAIIGITHLLKDSPINTDQQEMIKLMDYSSKSLLGIVNDILESSQIDAGKINIVNDKVNIVNLVQTISDLTTPMALEKGLILTCSIDKETPEMIIGDALRLNQILINLINNSIKFTTAGNIAISLQVIEKSDHDVVLEIQVKDTGIGIPAVSIDHIFDRFEQIEDKTWQKFGGTGLGLSIVKRLIELMDGEIKVESEMGKGTAFTFKKRFELAAINNSLAQPKDKVQMLSKFNDICILLAEDNLINQFVAINILKSWNITVDVAENGLEAFEKLKLKNYNLILMDIHMPVMNGNEATRKIRKELLDAKKDIPIISFSASVIDHEKKEARDAGVNDFIEKPFDPQSLHDKIANLTDKK